MLELEIHRHTPQVPWTYAILDSRQREIQRAIVESGARGRILLSEVAPVITLGRLHGNAGLRRELSEIRAHGVDLHPTDRGGRATYHGPGQWVLFVVERLDRLVGDSRGVKETFRRLEKMALTVAQEWEPRAEAREGKWSGIWSDPSSRARKLVSFGVKVDRGVLLHGLALNAYRAPESFFGIAPCDLPAEPGFLMGPEVRSGRLPPAEESEFLRVGERLVQETWKAFDSRNLRSSSV